MLLGQIFLIPTIINTLILIGKIIFTIYGFILFIKLTNRGLLLMDIYINKNIDDAVESTDDFH